jgi:4-amino-4-deoxy-L-arabinose transferase-like glycosyltransferase
MLYVSLYVEGLRSRPALVFWLAALAQAALWVLVPTLFYVAPPGELPEVLAVGHEFQLGSYLGPPLAFWVAEIAFRLAGLFGVYALSQICVVVTYWCVFALGSAMVGRQHAAMAVLLMVGISAFTVPTPDFGPPILAMALWAVILLQYWRAVAQGSRRAWYALAVAAGLLLLTTYVGLILLGLLVIFTVATEQGRKAIDAIEPWIAAVIIVLVLFPHLLWLEGSNDMLMPALKRLQSAEAADRNSIAWLRLLAGLVLAHAGLGILVVLASGWPSTAGAPPPAIIRSPVDPFAVTFLKVFALAPGLLATIFAVLIGRSAPVGEAAPLVVLSGLAVIVFVGDTILLHHQRILAFAWTGLLLVPAIIAAAAIVVLPWTLRVDLKIAQPAEAMGHFFAENFQRRTGLPLVIVAGDSQLAALIALTAPSRPSVYFDAAPERSPWLSADDLRRNGALVVWPAADTAGAAPPDIKARFPDLVPEVPRAFERPVQGLLPLLRIGWAVIRPSGEPAAAR